MDERITTAGIFIKKNKVLIAKRREGGSISEKWEFPGGKNRWGESIEDTLKREFKEELGVEIEVKDEIFSLDFENKDMLYHLKACLIEIPNESYSLNFHTELRMAEKEELLSYDFAPTDREIAKCLIEKYL